MGFNGRWSGWCVRFHFAGKLNKVIFVGFSFFFSQIKAQGLNIEAQKSSREGSANAETAG